MMAISGASDSGEGVFPHVSATGVLSTSRRAGAGGSAVEQDAGTRFCESLAQASPVGTGSNTTAGAAGVEAGWGLAVDAAAAMWLAVPAGGGVLVASAPKLVAGEWVSSLFHDFPKQLHREKSDIPRSPVIYY